MDVDELEAILGELRRFRTDTQDVEAKRATGGLPNSTHETLSAFGNADGGLYLLGVDEAGGEFNVTGVGDVQAVLTALQSEFGEMQPPVRTLIETINHPDGVVITARIPAVPRNQRPAHRRVTGPFESSYVRVGDGDQRLTPNEVSQMLAETTPTDHTARSADTGRLDGALVEVFVSNVQSRTTKTDFGPDEILRNYGVVDGDGAPTIAGMLVLGDTPERSIGAARLAYRRHPTDADPEHTRHEATHIEGTIGSVLDETLAYLARDLPTLQIERSGGLVDDSDVPRTALRELLSNALVHRSFNEHQVSATVVVDVFEEAVVITSPGGIHVGTDPATLGMLTVLPAVRNLSLVRIAEQMTTPSGRRIIEQQNMGIRRADSACREAGVMPTLFADHPTSFSAALIRGALDTTAAAERLATTDLVDDAHAARLLAAAERLADIHERPATASLRRVSFDARFAARVLAPTTPEDATLVLHRLEEAKVLERVHTRAVTSWRIRRVAAPVAGRAPAPAAAAPPPAKSSRRAQQDSNILDVLATIAGSPGQEMRPKDIAAALGLTSPSSRNRRIRAAEEQGLIRATRESVFDPNQSYVLTDQGRGRLQAARR